MAKFEPPDKTGTFVVAPSLARSYPKWGVPAAGAWEPPQKVNNTIFKITNTFDMFAARVRVFIFCHD